MATQLPLRQLLDLRGAPSDHTKHAVKLLSACDDAHAARQWTTLLNLAQTMSGIAEDLRQHIGARAKIGPLLRELLVQRDENTRNILLQIQSDTASAEKMRTQLLRRAVEDMGTAEEGKGQVGAPTGIRAQATIKGRFRRRFGDQEALLIHTYTVLDTHVASN